MKKFKLFEHVVFLIQNSLKDSENTIVRKNVKLKDRSGGDNEFDVLVESVVNDLPIKIVFECKDKGRPTERAVIDSFAGKCLRIPQINKRVFVSRSGFQSGAIEAAKYHSIDLFTLKELEEIEIKDWFDPRKFKTINHEQIIKTVQIKFKDEEKAESIKKSTFTTFWVQLNGIEKSITIKDYLKAIIDSTLGSGALIINQTGKPIVEERLVSIKLDTPLLSLSIPDKKEWHPVTLIIITVLEKFVPVEAELIRKRYEEFGDNEGEMKIISAIFDNEKSISLLKKGDEIRVFEENPDKGNRIATLSIKEVKST